MEDLALDLWSFHVCQVYFGVHTGSVFEDIVLKSIINMSTAILFVKRLAYSKVTFDQCSTIWPHLCNSVLY